MWNLKFLYTFLFIVYSLHHILTVQGKLCKINFLQKLNTSWTFSNGSPLPADNVTQDVKFTTKDPTPNPTSYLEIIDSQTVLDVRGGIIKENFTLVLFAIPFKKNLGECPGVNDFIKHEDLRQNEWVDNITSQNLAVLNTSFWYIFTGCYYTVMMNNNGEKFLAKGPEFYNTNYTLPSTRLIPKTKVSFVPNEGSRSKALITTIQVPSKFIKVIARLYAWNEEIQKMKNISIDKIVEDRSSLKQYCKIKLNDTGNGVIQHCEQPVLTPKPILEVDNFSPQDNQWKAKITWTNLWSPENMYQLAFEPDFSEWDRHYNRFAWRSARTSDFVLEIVGSGSNDPKSEAMENESSFWGWIAIAIIVSLMVMIFILAMSKYLGLWTLFDIIKNYVNNQVRKVVPISENPTEKKESADVLLIYSREGGENSPLNSVIEKLKHDLKKDNSKRQVHDPFASNIPLSDGESAWTLGISTHVEKLLKDGCKVVWIDTPEFRSLVKDEQEQHTANDGREDAIRYAFSMAKDCLLNARTQYRRHFVVRVKGYEVSDGSEDPLQIFTPHVRYCIPDQLFLLRNQLRSTADDSENGVTRVETV